MKRASKAIKRPLLWLSLLSCSAVHAADPLNADMLQDVQALYGITESAAIDRLAREHEASDIYHMLQMEPPRGYAGAWFDGTVLRVGLATDEDLEFVRSLGAEPVRVTFSLEELERAKEHFLARSSATLKGDAVQSAHVDFAANRVLIVALPEGLSRARVMVSDAGLDARAFDFVEGDVTLEFTANIVGATRTRNLTWEVKYPDSANICSVGVSLVGGFATNGHCGEVGDAIANGSGTTIGTVQQSTYTVLGGKYDGQDSAWVSAGSGWTPSPYVNGYSNGTITVPAKWAALSESPVGTTVCMYGATSGGPDCGSVAALNVDLGQINAATQVSNVCSQDGDSGGPFLATNYQVQGTTIGKNSACTTTWFQPITDTLGRFGKTMLTAHGASTATVSNYRCPDLANSGGGTYSCAIDHYNSQGSTTLEWTRGNGTKSSLPMVSGSCTAGQYVTVKLRIYNPYGTYSRDATFACPTGPMP